jgi:hypothetical protein
MPETVTAPDGTPVNAIRGQLGLAPATVRVHLSRAVAALRHQFVPIKTMEVDR